MERGETMAGMSTNWRNAFAEGKEVVLVTCSSDARPNANVVISLGFIEGRLVMADCQMHATIQNLRQNSELAVVGGYFRLRGKAKLKTSGKYFDWCVKKSPGYTVKTAILVDIQQVMDLDKQKLVFGSFSKNRLADRRTH